MYNPKTFFKYTFCEFTEVEFDFTNVKFFVSKSGSKYHYTEQGVYRYSNHWGRVADCRWKLRGVENYKNQTWYAGYASWSDFYNLKSTEKVVFFKVTINPQKIEICFDNQQNSSKYLFSLSQAFRRKKEIEHVLKNDKWMYYTNLSVQQIKEQMVFQLVNSSKKIQEIKQNITRC